MTERETLSERLIEYFTILCENDRFPPVETKMVDDCKALEDEVVQLKTMLYIQDGAMKRLEFKLMEAEALK